MPKRVHHYIKSFAAKESHYARQSSTSDRYLSSSTCPLLRCIWSHLSLTSMQSWKEGNSSLLLCRSFIANIFNTQVLVFLKAIHAASVTNLIFILLMPQLLLRSKGYAGHIYVWPESTPDEVVNPRRACTARVTVVGSVCLSVSLCVCLLLNISPLECLFVS